MKGAHPDVLVIGGGIVGMACARELADEGLQVVLAEARPRRVALAAPERAATPEGGAGGYGRGAASAAAAGMLSLLLDAPEPHLDPRVAVEARDLWRGWAAELAEESGIDVGHDESGALFLALDGDGEARLAEVQRYAANLGEPADELSLAETRRLLDGGPPDLRRALLLGGEHRVDNVAVLSALETSLRRRGVRIHWQSPVRSVAISHQGIVARLAAGQGSAHRTNPGMTISAGAVLLAAGAWSGDIDGLDPLPVHPRRGQMLRFDGVSWPWAGSVRADGLYALRQGRSGLLVGASLEECGFAEQTTPEVQARLEAFARRLDPRLVGRAPVARWAGLRPATPDLLPVMGPTSQANVFAATGHFRDGILLAPWTARAIAACLRGTGLPPEIAPYATGRFRQVRGLRTTALV